MIEHRTIMWRHFKTRSLKYYAEKKAFISKDEKLSMLSDVAVLSASWRLEKCQVTVVNDDRRQQEHVRGARHSRWRCPRWSDGSPRDHESPWRSYCICPPEQFRLRFHPAAHWIQPLSFQQSAKHNNKILKHMYKMRLHEIAFHHAEGAAVV